MTTKRPKPNYGLLFETLPPKEFLGCIFFTPHFARTLSHRWNVEFEPKMRGISQLFNYYHEDDLYNFFVINHSLHKNKSQEDYRFRLYALIVDLLKDLPTEEFEELNLKLIAKPEYVYYSNHAPELSNIARDFLYYGLTPQETRKKHTLTYDVFVESMKEIHQEELLPLDISLQSYY